MKNADLAYFEPVVEDLTRLWTDSGGSIDPIQPFWWQHRPYTTFLVWPNEE